MELVKIISDEKGMSENEVKRLIEVKRKELDYLISEEGAAHILASEYGLNISPQIKIARLKGDLSGVDIYVKIKRVGEKREFERKGKKGKVMNLLGVDDTGEIAISFWDDKAELDISEGDMIKISNSYVKETGRGLELRAGKRSTIETTPARIPAELKGATGSRGNTLEGAEDGDIVDVRAEIVNIADREPFFERDGVRQLMVICTIDDGTKSMPAVMFRNTAEVLIRMKRKKAVELADAEGFEAVLKRVPLFRELRLRGRIQHSEYSGENEIIVNRIRRVDPGQKVDHKLNKMMGV